MNVRASIEPRSTGRREVAQKLYRLLENRHYHELCDELAQAEILEEISEFDALNLQAMLALIEGSEFAMEYLEMAEIVASTPRELAIVMESLAVHDLMQGSYLAAAERCVTTLEQVFQTEGLWVNLLIALARIGDMDTISLVLEKLVQLGEPGSAEVASWLFSEPDLRELCVQSASRLLRMCC
jgi:hypothetical protein